MKQFKVDQISQWQTMADQGRLKLSTARYSRIQKECLANVSGKCVLQKCPKKCVPKSDIRSATAISDGLLVPSGALIVMTDDDLLL